MILFPCHLNAIFCLAAIKDTQVEIPRSKICEKQVSVCALYKHLIKIGKSEEECVYEDLIVDSCRDGECNPLGLESGKVLYCSIAKFN